MRRHGEKNERRFGRNGGFARAALAALLAVLLTLQSGPTQALAVVAEEAAEQQLIADLTAGDPNAEAQLADALSEGDGTGEKDGANDQDAETEQGAAAEPDAEPSASVDDSASADEAPAAEAPESSASYAADDELALVTVQGTAAASEDAAAAALADEAGLDDKTARDAAAALFAAPIADPLPAQGDEGSDLPSEGDGSFVNNISVRWMTADSSVPSDAADGVQAIANEESVLYQCPSSNASQSVRMRVSYALSGEQDYDAGDVTITIPANIFTNRDGKAEGRMRLSMPENPDTSAEWNYQLVGDSYVITNTRPMSAATQGYMEFLIEDLRPSDLVDMAESAPFNATIEVVTHAGNLIGLKSDDITARFDTHAEIQSATKRQSGAVRRVPASEIPEGQRIDGEEEYVVVSWYMNSYVPQSITTEYDLTLRDTVGTVLVEGEESDIRGFLIDETDKNGDGASYKDAAVFDGYSWGISKYTYVEVAYPFSKFEKETNYTFQNSVEYTLTEKDADVVGSDGSTVIDVKKVTKAPAESAVDWYFEDPVFVEPRGHFNVFKYGNSDTPSGDGMETISPTYYTSYSDLHDATWPGYSPWNGYFGSYPSALNDLRDGEDTTISYTINTVGFLLPWTYKEVESPEGGNPLGILENYGQRSVTMTTEDTGLRVGDTKLELGSDYVYQSVEFPKRPDIMKATAINLNEDGSVSFGSADDGTVDYEVDKDYTKTPDVTLQIKRDGGDWETWATANWSNSENGELSLTPASGAQIDPNNEAKVLLPEGTTAVRTQVSAKNAAVLYHIRVNATLLGDGAMGTMAKDAFEGTTNPSLNVWNGTTMTAVQDDTQSPIVVIDKEGYDTLRGYTTDTRVMAEKSARPETDYENQIATVHYSAKVRNQTFITDETVFEEALESGEVQAERGGTWYDLLPRGMVPKLDTVNLRDGDAVREMYTIENYQGSGRTLLVVSADLTPVPTEYSVEELDYYEDVITIEFDATYNAESFLDYGNETHNVIAYRSDNEQIGTVEGYRGENNPNGSNNNGTAAAFADGEEGTEERELLGTLVEDEGSRNFLYAGADCTIDNLELGRTGLNKTVMVNSDGRWSSGLEYGDESKARDVYVSGLYSYRLGFDSGLDTKTSDIILYDSLENYEPTADNNDGVDTNTPRWKGTFAGIDLTPLEEMGCAPVVYYSTKGNLVLEEGGVDPKPSGEQVIRDKVSTDLTNEDVWQLLTDDVDPSVVKAIAVDATKRADGTPFVLDPEQSCSVIVHMRAPQGNAASEHVKQDAHAFNNIYMAATTQDIKEGSQPAENFIRQDYTKVGLVEYELNVKKVWADEDDRDGKRPDSVTVNLYANGEPAVELPGYDWTEIQTSLVLNEENNWSGSFGKLPLYEDDGSKIIYSLVEDGVPGYETDIRFDGDHTYTITNRHEPERIDLSGTKTWVGDTEGARPDSIKVNLYANGVLKATQTVRADIDGNWQYSFENLYKYENGSEVVYSVNEDVTYVPSYIPSVDGTDITNTYHPYGDLIITKQVTGATEVSADKEFSFTLQFTRTASDGETEEPIFDSFSYVVYGPNDEEVNKGTVATNGTITLKDGQRAVVSDIPEYVHYQVTEKDEPGFSQSATGATGTIEPNDEQTASFVNTYSASGSVSLGARKRLTGRDLNNRQFTFELRDEDGNLLRTASSGVPDNTGEDADGNTVGQAAVTFGELFYTQKDHGKTYRYTITEYAPDAPGYTYDKREYVVHVKLTDNGDGTMDASATYSDEDGNVVDAGAEGVVFENSYAASGSLTLNAYKTMTGGELTEGAFTFELGEVVQGEGGAPQFSRISKATNDANGTVTFQPISYDQSNVGDQRIYAIREVAGADGAVIYDGHWGYVCATVSDNGNGTLSVATEFEGFEAPCLACGGDGVVEANGACADCGGDGVVDVAADSISFENRYVDGALDIEKTVIDDTTGADPNQTFTFRVELTNEEGQPLDGITADDVTFEGLSTGTTTPATGSSEDSEQPASAKQPAEEPNPLQDFLFGLLGIETAHAVEIADDEGTWSWSLDDAGTLTISGTGIGKPDGNNFPWYSQRSEIKKVVFAQDAQGQGPEAGDSLTGAFSYCTNLQAIEWNNLDTSKVTDMSSMFKGCSSLVALDLSNLDTSAVTTMVEMFNGCTALADVDLSGLDTSKVENMRSMFESCMALTKVDLSTWNTTSLEGVSAMFRQCGIKTFSMEGLEVTSLKTADNMFLDCKQLESVDLCSLRAEKVTRFQGMFQGCTNLKTVSNFFTGTASVTNIYRMFSNCSSLTSLDLSKMDVSAVTDMYAVFSGCSKLEELNLSGWNTASATNMGRLFYECKQLSSLEMPGWTTDKVMYMECMFYGCGQLTSLDLSKWDVSSVTSMYSMFEGCNSLTSLNLTGWDTDSVSNMSGMFSGCKELASLEGISTFKTSKVINMSNLFKQCESLPSIDVSGWDTSAVTNISGMFQGCDKLTSLDLSKWNTANITDMSDAFLSCDILASLDLAGWSTEGIKSDSKMANMFNADFKLASITLGSSFRWPEKTPYWDPNLPLPEVGDGWIRIDETTGLPASGAKSYTPEELAAEYPSCGEGTYVWNTFLTIKYDANGGTGSMSDQLVNVLNESTLNTSTFTRPGFAFTGWNVVQNGSGQSYADGQVVQANALLDNLKAGSLTLYAQWKNATSVTVTEGVLEITMPANYVAHIKDLPSGTSYRVYEQTPTGWVLVSSDNTTGTIQPDQTQRAAFVNAYKPAEAQVQIVASKMLDGAWADADSGFQFELVENGEVVYTAGVSDGGAVVFEPITYTAAGEHAYTIREKAGTDTAIDYDDTQFTVNVSVSEDAAGNLVATVKYPGDGSIPVFTNTTKPGSLSITKKAVGANDAELTDAVKDAEFTFLLTVNGSPYAGDYAVGGETRSTPDGTILLRADETATVDGLKRGDAYAVTEVEVPAGWTAGTAPNNAAGTIAAGDTVALEFTNVYAAAGQAQLVAYKDLPGAQLEAGQFQFALYEGANPAEDAQSLQTVANGAVDGTEFLPGADGEPSDEPNPTYGLAPAYFSPLAYTLADVGAHVYTIREVVPAEEDGVPGVTYDESAWTATVTVTDNGDGTLSTAVSYAKNGEDGEHAVFTNNLRDTQLRVEKQVKDEESLSDAAAANLTFEFTISLKDAAGESLEQPIEGTVYDAATNEPVDPAATIEVSDGGSFSLAAGQYVLFTDVPYGTVYEVTEAERPGWSQVADETTSTSGVTSDTPSEATFVNAYSATGEAVLQAAKTIDGRLPEDGEYTFLLYELEGTGAEPDLTKPLQRVTNDANGMVKFAPIEYTAADDGKTFTYEIRELQGTEEDIRYDETVVTAKVVVTDKGDGTMGAAVTYFVDGKPLSEGWYTFQNWLTVTLARTGGPGVWAAGAGTVAVALGCVAYLRRKRECVPRGAKHARR